MSLLDTSGLPSRGRRKVTTYGRASRKRHLDFQEADHAFLPADDKGLRSEQRLPLGGTLHASSQAVQASGTDTSRPPNVHDSPVAITSAQTTSASKGLLRPPTSSVTSDVSINAKTTVNKADPVLPEHGGTVKSTKKRRKIFRHLPAYVDASPDQSMENVIASSREASVPPRQLRSPPTEPASSQTISSSQSQSSDNLMAGQSGSYRTESLDGYSTDPDARRSSTVRGRSTNKSRPPSSPERAASHGLNPECIPESKAGMCKTRESPSRKLFRHDRICPSELTSPGRLKISSLQLSGSATKPDPAPSVRVRRGQARSRQTARPCRDGEDVVANGNRISSEAGLVTGTIKERNETNPQLPKGPKITYAARSRTVMKDLDYDPLSLLPSNDMVDLPQQPPKRELNIDDARPASGARDLDAPHGVIDIPSGPLRSVRELRQAGISARVERETDALFDDISACTTVSQQQLAFHGLALRAQSESFLKHLGAEDHFSRLFSLARETSDWLCKAVLAATIARVVKSIPVRVDLSFLASAPGREFFAGLLEDAGDLVSTARNHKPRVSSSVLQRLGKLCNALLASTLWRFGAPSIISPRSLALQCLDLFAQRSQQYRTVMDGQFHSVVKAFAGTLDSSMVQQSSTPSRIPELLLCLSILEISTFAPSGTGSSSPRSALARLLGERLPSFLSISGDVRDDVWSGALRVLLNITNNDTDTCGVLSTTRAIAVLTSDASSTFVELSSGEWTDEQHRKLDNLVLSLGVLINVAENSDRARKAFHQHGGGGSPPVESILRLFLSRVEDAFEVSFRESCEYNLLISQGRFRGRIPTERRIRLSGCTSGLPLSEYRDTDKGGRDTQKRRPATACTYCQSVPFLSLQGLCWG